MIDNHPSYEVSTMGKIRNISTGKQLQPYDDGKGYLRVKLDGENCRLHILVAIIKDGENGLLVEVDDAAGASKAVLRIYKEKDLKEKIIAQGLEDVHNRFNARRVSEEHSKLFDKEMD